MCWIGGAVREKLRSLLNPKIILSTLLSAALLVFVLTFANSREIGDEVKQALTGAVIPAFFLTILYLAAKLTQWRIYLGRLGVKPGWRELLVPYAGGEMGNSLPMGVYVENYLLNGSFGSGVGRSAAATTWMLITEIVTCLLALLLLGVPGWLWVRPASALLLVGMLLVGWVFFRTRLVCDWLAKWRPQRKGLQSAREGIRDFVEGSHHLFSWHTFVYGLPLTAFYLGAQATILFVIGNVLIAPTQQWSWTEATAAYAFSLVIVLLIPFLPHLGSVEVSGLAVMLQFAISKNLEAGVFLSLRLLATGTILLVCGGVLIALHREVGVTFRRLSRQGAPGKKGYSEKITKHLEASPTEEWNAGAEPCD
jgi:Lysylphosphatidylglycerol synthase TM region